MKHLGFIWLFLLHLSFAGEVKFDDELKTELYVLSETSYSGDEWLLINCYDMAFSNDYYRNGDLKGAKAAIETARSIFDTDSVLICYGYGVKGSPSYYAHNFVYVYQNVQYSLDYRNVAEAVGSAGQIREGAHVGLLLSFPNVP